MAFEPIFAESAPIFVKNSSFHFFKNPHLCLFSRVLEVKLKFQDNSYNRINNNKCPSSEDEVCILRNSYFHKIQPKYNPPLPRYIYISTVCCVCSSVYNVM